MTPLEHDPTHRALAFLLGRDYSPTLRWVETGALAHPTRHDDAVGVEEDIVVGLQQFMATGQFNGAIRILFFLGYTEDEVRAALQNVEGTGQ